MSNTIPTKEIGGELKNAKSPIMLAITERSATALTTIRAHPARISRKKPATTPTRYKSTKNRSMHNV